MEANAKINCQQVLELAVYAGEILLKNGAEIARVQETATHFLHAYGYTDFHLFVIANGIFATLNLPDHAAVAVRDIPMGRVHLSRIAAVNDLSRKITEAKEPPPLGTLKKELDACANKPETNKWLQVAGCAFGCAGFCYLLGGSVMDSLAALIVGSLMQCCRFLARRLKQSAFVLTILGAALATVLSALLYRLGLGQSIDRMITGAIIIFVPGIALTNSIRDLFNGDYLSGVTRLIQALLQAICIAVGVGVALYMLRWTGVLL